VRVLGPDGAQLGVMDLRDAVQAAKERGLTLVEVAAKVDPPVCRIVEYGKWRYDQSKQKKNKEKTIAKMKEVKFRVRTEEHDYNIKMGRLEEFLDNGNKVRVQLQFRGRENAHKELGVEVWSSLPYLRANANAASNFSTVTSSTLMKITRTTKNSKTTKTRRTSPKIPTIAQKKQTRINSLF